MTIAEAFQRGPIPGPHIQIIADTMKAPALVALAASNDPNLETVFYALEKVWEESDDGEEAMLST